MRVPEHILSLSYGKDSLACLGAIEELGWPLDRIVHAEVWATDTIPADLPPMVEFKAKADEWIKARYGIEVEHTVARDRDGKRLTYESVFFKTVGEKAIVMLETRKRLAKTLGKVWRDDVPKIYGFPLVTGAWCNSKLKMAAIPKIKGFDISYLGIAADEPERIARQLVKTNVKMPLVEAGWTESFCRKWCEERGLLSPIYTTATRGGCWFCHNQGVDQLRLLRHNYPEYWTLLLKWDLDSPVPFKPDGHTVHDFDRRFELEDQGIINPIHPFRWAMLDGDVQLRF